ncbi:MAG: phosphate import ATP-binding protein PstB [Actinomycetota bacterium]|jgi:phosphate transport system ATP-binding protein
MSEQMKSPTDAPTGRPEGSATGGATVRFSMDAAAPTNSRSNQVIMEAKDLAVSYGSFKAVRDVSLTFHRDEITALIGPSGCGKSTILRCFNRMNDLIPTAKVEGSVTYQGIDLYGPLANVGEVRRRIGMVFQKPNPFPKSIYENVAFGPKVNGKPSKSELDDIVEESLQRAALWNEVKTVLKASAYSLSGGQQQRLCIARALAVKPDMLLMDEPCSALDPIATSRIEDLMREIKVEYPIVIVTHNMQQAARVSDRTAFFNTEPGADNNRPTGILVEYGQTSKIFASPDDERTENYISGRMG